MRPLISIIIPVSEKDEFILNAICINSIFKSNYPASRIQVIVKRGLPAEQAKGDALKEAKGDYVCFLDADNEVTPGYFDLAIGMLELYPQAFGVEACYEKCGSSLNTFLTTDLHISDPISLMITNPTREEGELQYWRGSYPLGANGFVYRKKDLDDVKATENYEDTDIPLRILKKADRPWIRLEGGIKHYYANTFDDFFKKRVRQTFHYLKRNSDVSWIDIEPRMPVWAAFLYCISFVGPLFTTICNLRRTWRWLYWLPCCYTSALGLLYGALKYYANKISPIDECSLQPSRLQASEVGRNINSEAVYSGNNESVSIR